ncbi:MAG: hypothetical protein ACE5OS_12950 [Anaerolineae bacterium]
MITRGPYSIVRHPQFLSAIGVIFFAARVFPGEFYFGPNPDSDVDVMVVVAWEEERLPDGFYRSMYCDPRWERIIDLATDVNLDFGIYISPIVIGSSRFEEWSPLMHSV